MDTDKSKIIWCQLLIGATGNSILAGLEEDTTWNTAKETLLSRLGAGSVRDEAWVALKNLTRGTKEIIELAGEAEKLAKRLHPQDTEAVERHAVDAFLGALDRSLAAEVRKLVHTQMEGVVADARRIEKILQEQPTPAADSALEAMNRQIQILKKDLVKANERLIAQSATPPPTASLASLSRPHSRCGTASPGSFGTSNPSHRPWYSHLSSQCRLLHTRIGRRILHFTGARTDGRTDGRQGASSVTRKATLPTDAPLAHYCNAC